MTITPNGPGGGTRRLLVVALALALVVGIAAAVWYGRRGDPRATDGADLRTVTGVIGSEKQPFFADPDVRSVFAGHGLRVDVRTAGSRQIATTYDLAGVDFAFPSSAPAAEKIEQKTGRRARYAPFYSPLAVATFEPVAQLLEQSGVTRRSGDQWYLDLARYQDLVDRRTRWRDLPGAAGLYDSPRAAMISSTDIRTSNSAAMYLAAAAFVRNDNRVVATEEEADRAADASAGLFLDQGYAETSSEGPFSDYLSQGIGAKPMVMVYEAQFLGRRISESGRAAITPSMRLMYPTPTVTSKHTVVGLTDAGDEVGRLLTEEPELARLAARYGFRPGDAAVFGRVLAEAGVPAPPDLVAVADPPRYDLLERMVSRVEARFAPGAGTAPTPDADKVTPH